MPRSRSRSLLSIIRSATCWCLANVPAWTQELVDERRLAVIDVGDDGDVAQGAGSDGHGWLPGLLQRGMLTPPNLEL